MIKITLDTSKFKRGIIIATGKVERASREGMKGAVKAFMDDCLDMPPTCPRKTGAMAASHSVFVDGHLVGTSADRSVSVGGRATPLMFMPKISKELIGTLAVHKPYATSIHEGVSRWGTSYIYRTLGTGRKWVQSKLTSLGSKYFNLIAARIRITR